MATLFYTLEIPHEPKACYKEDVQVVPSINHIQATIATEMLSLLINKGYVSNVFFENENGEHINFISK